MRFATRALVVAGAGRAGSHIGESFYWTITGDGGAGDHAAFQRTKLVFVELGNGFLIERKGFVEFDGLLFHGNEMGLVMEIGK